MSKLKIEFNSRSEVYKVPVGPIVSGQNLTIRVKVAGENIYKVLLVIQYDRHDIPAYYDMNGIGDDIYEVTFPIHDRGLYWYHFEVDTDEGRLMFGKSGSDNKCELQVEPKPWQQSVYLEDYDQPEWIYGGIFYHIFIDRFYHVGKDVILPGKELRKDWGGMPKWKPVKGEVLNNDFFGGNLEGIRAKLPYLRDLGVTCLYLSPIFEAYSNHKYDTSDYLKVDPMFGTEKDFSRLCKEAKAMGMRVILDGVFAHTGSDSVYFNKKKNYGEGGAWNDPKSPYRSWYDFKKNGKYDCWWGIDTLPKVNKNDPTYREFISGEEGVARHWLKAGASGWRLDVADELPSSFLEEFVKAVKTEKSDALVIGEVWEDASNKSAYDERKNYFEGNKLDSVMNYPFKNALIKYMRTGDAKNIATTVEEILENYPPAAVNALMNNIGTHDSIRAITSLAGKEINACLETRPEQAVTYLGEEGWARGIKMLKTCSLIQMTLPGVPCVYYGDEAGVEGYSDPFNRTCYPWGHENKELMDWYHKIIKIRRSHKVYERGLYRTLVAEKDLYVFERYNENESVITATNVGTETLAFGLEGKYKDLVTGEVFENEVVIAPDRAMALVSADAVTEAAPVKKVGLIKRLLKK